MTGLLGRLWGGTSPSTSLPPAAGAAADGKPAADGAFCHERFPEMFKSFVDHVIDCAYTGTAPAPPSDQSNAPELPLRLPAAERLVAIGDLHGDLPKARRAFQLAGLTDGAGNWIGGNTVCVQVGDILDRGDQELPILYFLESLQHQAAASGGALHVLNGNHETMNVAGNYRYATAGADTEMAAWASWQLLGDRLRHQCGCGSTFGQEEYARAAATGVAAARDATPAVGGRAAQYNPMRRAALRPGGPVARRFFAHHPTVLQVGSTLFVHGGVLQSHVEYGLDKINTETQQWLLGGPAQHPNLRPAGSSSSLNTSQEPAASLKLGQSSGGSGGSGSSSSGGSGWWFAKGDATAASGARGPKPAGGGSGVHGAQAQQHAPPQPHTPPPAPGFLRGAHAIVWARDYSARDEARCDCEGLKSVLEALPGAKRMVVGHTIQDGGITSACAGRVFRVDVGMSRGCGDGEPEVLEILGDSTVRRLTEAGAPEVIWSQGPSNLPTQQHQPHHLSGPAVDTPSGGVWVEALQRLQRWREVLLERVATKEAGGSSGSSAAEGQRAQDGNRNQPTPA